MKKSSKRQSKREAPGPNTVRAWFDTVINPILGGLEDERRILLRYDWTWQFRPGLLDRIRPVERFVPLIARANLHQFLGYYPKVKSKIAEHDGLVTDLAESCVELQKQIVIQPEFQKTYDELTKETSLRSAFERNNRQNVLSRSNLTRSDLLADTFGGYPPQDHLSLLAQYVINNTGMLPDHMTTAPFWNEYRDQFLNILKVAKIQKQYVKTTGIGSRLLQASDTLAIQLDEIRLRLSSKYDVPYVEPSAVPQSRGIFD